MDGSETNGNGLESSVEILQHPSVYFDLAADILSRSHTQSDNHILVNDDDAAASSRRRPTFKLLGGKLLSVTQFVCIDGDQTLLYHWAASLGGRGVLQVSVGVRKAFGSLLLDSVPYAQRVVRVMGAAALF
ncbi:hypothetical protein EYF80_020735 [Liparis tanakae]|uniref:Uncharacterized protein n=1 Tax=Liparis tanakae TaxID=230148 RepID=A0A4Z2HVV4_9TELE|nr:hypothetical protein EYF80_020735 [Liparis tanakae]